MGKLSDLTKQTTEPPEYFDTSSKLDGGHCHFVAAGKKGSGGKRLWGTKQAWRNRPRKYQNSSLSPIGIAHRYCKAMQGRTISVESVRGFKYISAFMLRTYRITLRES